MKTQYIDFGHNADLPASVREAIPDEGLQTVFRAALNSHLRDGKSEMHSYVKAYRALEDMGYGKGDDGKWVRKDGPTVGDVHVATLIGGKKPKRKDDPGTDPADIPEFEEFAKRISGNSDIALNPKGERLAEQLGKRLAAKGGLDILYSSVLTRAIQTADCIEKQATPAGSIHRANPTEALCPWHLGAMEGRKGSDVKNLIAHYVEHPDEVPPGKSADGEPGESFKVAVKRQLDFLGKIYDEYQASPTHKVGVIMHARGLELLKSWVDDGQPADYEVDTDDLLKPDDPAHATVERWHKDAVDDIDLDSDDPLKPGVYLILHSLTEDDTDEGNPELQKTFVPPDEVRAAAKRAWDAGTAVLDVTAPLADGSGIGIQQIGKLAAHFADSSSATDSPATRDAWGGEHASKWASRVFRKFGAHDVSKRKTVETVDYDEVDVKRSVATASACELCEDCADQGWIEDGDVFDSGEDSPPHHPNCECSISYKTKRVKKGEIAVELSGSVAKVDEAQHLVFGWASIVTVNGKAVTDTQGDQIPESTIEQSAYDFVLDARVGGVMHQEDGKGKPAQIGQLVESMVFTPQKTGAMLQSLKDQGIHAEMVMPFSGWWVGFKVSDPKVWEAVISGKLKAFSVGGRGKRAAVAA